MSISGFKDAISEQSATESATEAVTCQEGGASPDTVSATSQSIDEPTKDVVRYLFLFFFFGQMRTSHDTVSSCQSVCQQIMIMIITFLSPQVSVLVLKVQSVCVGMEAVGESTAVALEVGKVTPSQLGNISLRQYLSNRSLGREMHAGVRAFCTTVHETEFYTGLLYDDLNVCFGMIFEFALTFQSLIYCTCFTCGN